MQIPRLKIAAAALAGAWITLAGSGAQAQTSLGDSLASPGVYFGSGNVNGQFAITNGSLGTNQDGSARSIELGLRAGIRFVGPVAPEQSGGNPTNIYNVPTGTTVTPGACAGGCALWNFEFSVHTTGLLISDLTEIALSVTDGVHSFIIEPDTIPDNATDGQMGFQNSENLAFFGGLGFPFDPEAAGTYTISLTAIGTIPASTAFPIDRPAIYTDTIVINASPIPEPASMTALAVGLLGMGLARRRKAPRV